MDFIDKEKQRSIMFTAFKAILREYNDFITDAVSEYDLSPNEIVVLSSLQNVSSASQIAKEADVSKALVSRSVKLLKQKDLIEVTISAMDKREQNLRLTDEGVKVAERIKLANERFSADALRNVEVQAIEMMKLLLKLIMRNLGIEEIGEIEDD